MRRCFGSRYFGAASATLLAVVFIAGSNDAAERARSAASTASPATTAAATKPVSSPYKAGEWTDLLKLGPEQPTKRRPHWTVVDGVLNMPRVGGGNRCSLVEDGPTGAYELSLTFDRNEGAQEFCVILPVGDVQGQVWMGGGPKGQSSSVQGVRAGHPAGVEIINGKEQTLLLSVRPNGENASITATLDGKLYFEATGPRAKMRAVRGYAVPGDHPRVIALAVHSDSSVSFKDIKVRLISAK